jgi:hypothetical protein
MVTLADAEAWADAERLTGGAVAGSDCACEAAESEDPESFAGPSALPLFPGAGSVGVVGLTGVTGVDPAS